MPSWGDERFFSPEKKPHLKPGNGPFLSTLSPDYKRERREFNPTNTPHPQAFPVLSEYAHTSLSALALQLWHIFFYKGAHTTEQQQQTLHWTYLQVLPHSDGKESSCYWSPKQIRQWLQWGLDFTLVLKESHFWLAQFQLFNSQKLNHKSLFSSHTAAPALPELL